MARLETMEPLVTIIVPCYNHGKYLKECLASVQEQNYAHFECIIVDDESTDDTRAIASSFCSEDSRFQYHFQRNKGLSGARNAGLLIAKGNLVNFLDADDALFPTMLFEIVTEMQADPELDLVYCGYIGSKQSLHHLIKEVRPGRNYKTESFFLQLCKGNALPVHAALVKRTVFDQIGFFDESLKSCEDWDLWLRLGRVTNRIKAISKPLVIYRMVSESMTRNVNVFFEAGLTVLKRIPMEDPRVKNVLPQFKHGCSDYMQITEKNWYRRAMGLHLAKKDSEAAWNLLLRLRGEQNQQLDAKDFLELWKVLLFGAILLEERSLAWERYRNTFGDFVIHAEELYLAKGLAKEAIKKVVYYNSPVWKRAILRLTQ